MIGKVSKRYSGWQSNGISVYHFFVHLSSASSSLSDTVTLTNDDAVVVSLECLLISKIILFEKKTRFQVDLYFAHLNPIAIISFMISILNLGMSFYD